MTAPTYASLGLRFHIRSDDPALGAALENLFAACRVADGPADFELSVTFDARSAEFVVSTGGDERVRSRDHDEILEWCAWSVNQTATAVPTSSLLVHGAAAAAADGAVLLVAPSGAGKSTLVAALTRAGYSYMGDDGVYVDCEPEILVRSNPKPLALDAISVHALGAFAPEPGEVRARSGTVAPVDLGDSVPPGAPRPPVLVVRPHYCGCPTNRAVDLRPADVAELLAEQSFNFAALGPHALRTVADVARRARGISVEYGDLGAAVELIRATPL